MFKIKKNVSQVVFFDVFFGMILVFLVSLGFFLGFDLTNLNITIWIVVILGIILVCCSVYFAFYLICQSYFVFEKDRLLFVNEKCEHVILKYNQIKEIIYYRWINLFLGNSKGGKLLIKYKGEEDEPLYIEISLPFKDLGKIPINFIIIK